MRRTRNALLLPILLTAACARTPPPALGVARRSPIDTTTLRVHTFFLAHDLLRGRGTGTPEADIAAAYIETACRELGLEPVAGSYGHAVPLVRVTFDPPATSVAVTDGGDTGAFRLWRDFAVGGGPAFRRGFAGGLAWAGSGDEITGRPERLPPLVGRVALTAGTVRPDAAKLLADRGAVGVIHLIGDAETYDLIVASRRDLLGLEDSTVASSFYPSIPAAIAGPALTTRLLEAARRQGTVRVTMAASTRAVNAENVGCLLRGTDAHAADTAIVLTAHYDHLGISTPDERGDSIYNGFSDNAAGVAMLLAIAQGIQRSPAGAFRHSLLLLFFTGEERGLLGSDYFVARPPYPLGRMRAVINLDAGAPPARPWNWRVAGGDDIPLGSLAMDVAASRGWAAVTSAATPNSDYFPFARVGVPAVFLIPGVGPYEGLSSDSSDALRRRWDAYHQAADAWYPDFPFEGLQRYAEFALALASAVDRYSGDLTGR